MKKIKPVIQKDLKDCGVCCMQYIFMYFDGYVRLEKLREDTCTNEQGTTAYHIIETFKKWGFDALGIFNKDITDNNLTYPLIAHVKLHNGLYHFVVVKNIIKNTVYIMDPSVGDKKLTIEEFNHIFTGNLILMHPRSKLIKMDKGLSIQDIFSTILCKEKFLVLKIIVTSLIMSISAIIISYYLKISQDDTSVRYFMTTQVPVISHDTCIYNVLSSEAEYYSYERVLTDSQINYYYQS